jgi:hypothetical protein
MKSPEGGTEPIVSREKACTLLASRPSPSGGLQLALPPARPGPQTALASRIPTALNTLVLTSSELDTTASEHLSSLRVRAGETAASPRLHDWDTSSR